MKQENLPQNIKDILSKNLGIPENLSDITLKQQLEFMIGRNSDEVVGNIITISDTSENRDLIFKASCQGEGVDPNSDYAKEEWGYNNVPVKEYLDADEGTIIDYI